ncbi:helix-turn-helix domain-containing protein [candidate division KSB1 bacterium]|nr:helix-turn-helix domain-containing protein [candidate division KSB1 bacterium]
MVQNWLDVQGLAEYLKVSKSYIYHKVNAGDIPFVKKGGLKFYIPHIDEWMLQEKDYYHPGAAIKWVEEKSSF